MSKWMVYQGLVEAGTDRYWIFLVAAMFGSALTLASFVKIAHAVFLGERPRELSGVTEVGEANAAPRDDQSARIEWTLSYHPPGQPPVLAVNTWRPEVVAAR